MGGCQFAVWNLVLNVESEGLIGGGAGPLIAQTLKLGLWDLKSNSTSLHHLEQVTQPLSPAALAGRVKAGLCSSEPGPWSPQQSSLQSQVEGLLSPPPSFYRWGDRGTEEISHVLRVPLRQAVQPQ